MLLYIDLQKVLDSVMWLYLSDLLSHCGFVPSVFTVFRSFTHRYICRATCLSHSRSVSAPIRGVLSNRLFGMTIEPLAIAICESANICGVRCRMMEHKFALFADDLLLFMASPSTILLMLFDLLDRLAVVSGLRVNVTKSTAINVSLPLDLQSSLSAPFSFSWSSESIPYWGVRLTSTFDSL